MSALGRSLFWGWFFVLWLLLGCRGAGISREVRSVAGEDEMALELDCRPDQAEVTIDGVWQGSCELLRGKRLRLPAGEHVLEVAAGGYRNFSSRLEARGMLQRLSVFLETRPGSYPQRQ